MIIRNVAAPCFRANAPFLYGRFVSRTNFGKCKAPNAPFNIRRKFMEQRNTSVKDNQSFLTKIFGKYLLATNTISSGVLMVIGDVMAQAVEKRSVRIQDKSNGLDWQRIWRMFIVGSLMGPLHHYVYIWMDRFWPLVSIRNSLQKILIDQLVMSPACIFLFFYSACFLEQKSVSETNKELKSKFAYIYLADWLFWPGAQYINFQYLDIKYRVTFVNVCTAVYNVFLSYMKHDFDFEWL